MAAGRGSDGQLLFIEQQHLKICQLICQPFLFDCLNKSHGNEKQGKDLTSVYSFIRPESLTPAVNLTLQTCVCVCVEWVASRPASRPAKKKERKKEKKRKQ